MSKRKAIVQEVVEDDKDNEKLAVEVQEHGDHDSPQSGDSEEEYDESGESGSSSEGESSDGAPDKVMHQFIYQTL